MNIEVYDCGPCVIKSIQRTTYRCVYYTNNETKYCYVLISNNPLLAPDCIKEEIAMTDIGFTLVHDTSIIERVKQIIILHELEIR